MRWLVVLVSVAACAPVPKPPPPIKETVIEEPTPVLVESEVDSPYVAVATPVLDEACATALAKPDPAAGRVAAPAKTKTYELVPIAIDPVRYGPRVRDMPITRHTPRTPTALSTGRWMRADALKACYRWARWAKPELAGTMTLAMDLDVLGNIAAIAVEEAETWGELGECVTSVMTPVQARTFIPRPTRLAVSIDFTLSGQNPPRDRPARPRAAMRPMLPKECSAAQAAVDAVSYASPIGKVDDYDEAQARREEAEATCKASGMKRCRAAVVPIVGRLGGPGYTGELDKAMIRSYVHYNDGAFGTCFADARDRGKGTVAGEVAILAVIAADGSMSRVEIEKSSTGDTVLDECVRAAFAELRFPAAPGGPVTVLHMPFVFGSPDIEIIGAPQDRDTVERIEQTAKDALDGGDTDSALRQYAALAKHEPTCTRQADLVRALHAARPWIDEPVIEAAADLVAMRPSGACATAATAALLPLATQAHRLGEKTQNAELLENAAERYRAILTFAPTDDAATIRAYLAGALVALHRKDEADALGVSPVSPKPQL